MSSQLAPSEPATARRTLPLRPSSPSVKAKSTQTNPPSGNTTLGPAETTITTSTPHLESSFVRLFVCSFVRLFVRYQVGAAFSSIPSNHRYAQRTQDCTWVQQPTFRFNGFRKLRSLNRARDVDCLIRHVIRREEGREDRVMRRVVMVRKHQRRRHTRLA